MQGSTTTQPESHQPVPTNGTYGNITLINQSVGYNENEGSTKRIPAGATRVLPPGIAPRPKQSKVCIYVHIYDI